MGDVRSPTGFHVLLFSLLFHSRCVLLAHFFPFFFLVPGQKEDTGRDFASLALVLGVSILHLTRYGVLIPVFQDCGPEPPRRESSLQQIAI